MEILELFNKILEFLVYIFTTKRVKEKKYDEWLQTLRDTSAENNIIEVDSSFKKKENKVRMERILSVMEQGCRNYIHYRFDRKSFKSQIEEDINELFKIGSYTRKMIYESSGYSYLKRYRTEILNEEYTSRNKVIGIFIALAILGYIIYSYFFDYIFR